MLNQLSKYLRQPPLYAPSTGKFWDDPHISKGMLAAHLNPDVDAATRNHDFISRSAAWIAAIAPPAQYGHLLDLGCGPGLYAEKFYNAGYTVTGIDFSSRSIAYAKKQAEQHNSNINYSCQNYMAMDYREQFDVITMIYCDYAALSADDRLTLSKKVYLALKENGKFIMDVFTPVMRRKASHTWAYYEEGGFFSQEPHLCLDSVYQYDDGDETELRQNIIITDDTVNCYHVWDHYFTKEKLLTEIQAAGFRNFVFYGDVAGKELTHDSQTICGVFTK